MDDERNKRFETAADDLRRAADALRGGGGADEELRRAQVSLDSRLEHKGADQSDIGR